MACHMHSLSQNDEYMAIVAAIKNLLYFFQKGDQANADYHEEFMAMMEVIEEYKGAGSLTYFLNLLKQELKAIGLDLSAATTDELKEGKKPCGRSSWLRLC
jgi:hypothetical protein